MVAALCPRAKAAKPPKGKPEPTPKDIQQVETQVEQARGLGFKHPVVTQAVTPEEMKKHLSDLLGDPAQLKYLTAQGRALATMGAIPEGTDLGQALSDFLGAQVAGFYEPDTKRLVFIGKKELSPLDRFILAHELTHAIDDQNFDFTRFGELAKTCQDDLSAAATAVAEGSATVYSLKVVLESFTALDKAAVVRQGMQAGLAAKVPESVPPFVVQSEEWPYVAGMRFIQYLQSRGGDKAVNAALKDPPVSSEQVIHPAKYGNDEPQQVTIPDFGPALGPDWKPLAAGGAGEEFISIYLAQRLDGSAAEVAAAGWDGGSFLSWTDGTETAVVLDTAWDTPNDAEQFGTAVRKFVAQGHEHVEVLDTGTEVRVLFGSDASTLSALESAA